MDVLCRSELIILFIHRSLSWVMPNNFLFLLQSAQPPGILLWQKWDHATSSLSTRGPAEPCPWWPLQHFPSHSLLTRQPTWVSSFTLLWPLSFPLLGICFLISSHSSLSLFIQISAHICPALFKVALSIPPCSWVWTFSLSCCSLTLYWSTLYHSYSTLESKQHEDKDLEEFPLAPQLLEQCLACRTGSITIDKGTLPPPLLSFPQFYAHSNEVAMCSYK